MTRSIKRQMKKKREEKTRQQPTLQALVWYKEEHYKELLELFPDRDRMPRTYQDWLVRAEELVRSIQAEGDTVVKVFIDPVTFPEWCRKKGVEPDAEARTRMAIEYATRQSFGSRV